MIMDSKVILICSTNLRLTAFFPSQENTLKVLRSMSLLGLPVVMMALIHVFLPLLLNLTNKL